MLTLAMWTIFKVFEHPFSGIGAAAQGGLISNLAIVFGVGGALFGALRHKNCHVKGCWKTLCHIDPDHGHPACRKHHSQAHKLG